MDRYKRWLLRVETTLGVVLLASLALGGYEPVLHENFEPDPKEDLAFGVRVTTAALPAALEASGNVVPVPNPTRPPEATEPVYGERRADGQERFRADRQTSDLGRLSYHEPFRPSIAPFKRTHVYDGVDANFELTVADPRPRPVAFENAPSNTADQFFADLVVELKGDTAVRVPSVGPHMRIYSAHLEPEASFGFYTDRAENWFLRAPTATGRARLVMHVGAERAVFDPRITAASYSALASELPRVPSNVERAATELLPTVGVSRVLSPSDALSQMVFYFRGFAESDAFPDAAAGEALYRELVRSRKGVCRHRAYAFVITSLGLGIPARFVHNEAHAWVEVFGGTYWHRIDLGGAAAGFDFRGEPPKGTPHRPAADPYKWPRRARAAEQAVPETPSLSESTGSSPASSGASGSSPTNSGASGSGAANPGANGRAPSAAAKLNPSTTIEAPPAADESGLAPASIVLVRPSSERIVRGETLKLDGSVASTTASCEGASVQLSLVRGDRAYASISTTSDGKGRFSAALVIPSDLSLGDYEIRVSSRATARCSSARAR
ncbi:MAG: transglutaminase-like domain-containing protein [Polyangiaceae bacterium]